MDKKEKATTQTRKVRILNKAFGDIDEITDFIAINNQQPLNAIKVTEAIFDTIKKLNRVLLLTKNVDRYLPKQKSTVRLNAFHGLLYLKYQKLKFLFLVLFMEPEILRR